MSENEYQRIEVITETARLGDFRRGEAKTPTCRPSASMS
jgi:hypothetical protein